MITLTTRCNPSLVINGAMSCINGLVNEYITDGIITPRNGVVTLLSKKIPIGPWNIPQLPENTNM